MTTPSVAICIDENGLQTVFICGDVNVYTVCELSPNDRVYKHSEYVTEDEITSIIGDSPIGSKDDARHAALSARVLGKPFTIVK